MVTVRGVQVKDDLDGLHGGGGVGVLGKLHDVQVAAAVAAAAEGAVEAHFSWEEELQGAALK